MKYLPEFNEWLNEATDPIVSINQSIQAKTEKLADMQLSIKTKQDASKETAEKIAKFKEQAFSATDGTSTAIAGNKAKMEILKGNILKLDAKVLTLKLQLVQEEIATLKLQKDKAMAQKTVAK